MKKTKTLSVILIAIISLSLLSGCGAKETSTPAKTKDTVKTETPAEKKVDFTMILVKKDGTSKEYKIAAKKGSTMREALYESKLISEEESYAQFVQVIDGEKADVANDGCLWNICDENGNPLNKNMDDCIVSDGATYKLVYTVVPNAD